MPCHVPHGAAPTGSPPARRRRRAGAAGLLLVAVALASAAEPTLQDLRDAELEMRLARGNIEQAAHTLHGGEAELARKAADALEESAATLVHLGALAQRRDQAASDEERGRLDEAWRTDLGQARPSVCAVNLRFVRRLLGSVHDESLLVQMRRALAALARSCAVLQGRTAPRAVGTRSDGEPLHAEREGGLP
jgi:hypothetical protein